MDVLNEVKKAEAEAERIEASYMEKISELQLGHRPETKELEE